MKLLTHFVAADARRFRLAIGLWMVIVVAETVVQHIGTLVTPYTREAETIATAGWLFWMSGVFVSCALVPLIVQLHPAVGSDAFWMTRPIPPRTLATAKLLLLLAVFVGVPLLVDQLVMALYEVPAGDRLRVAAQTMIFRGVVLVLLMAAAALTPNFGMFALLCGGVLFGFAMLLPLLTIIFAAFTSDAPSFSVMVQSAATRILIPFIPPHSFPTDAVLAAAVVAAGGIAAFVLQYRTRFVPIAVAALALSLAGVSLIATMWRSNAYVVGIAPEWADASGAVGLIAAPSDVRVEPSPPTLQARLVWAARVPIRMTPAAPGWLATARLERASLEVDSGARFAMRSDGYNVLLREPDGSLPLERALQHVLGVPYVVHVTTDRASSDSALALHLRGEDLTQTKARAATFQGEFRVDLARLDIVWTTSIEPGEYQQGAFRFTILDVRETPTGVILRTRVSGVSTFLDAAPRPAYSYFLRNQLRQEAVIGVPSEHREHLFLPFYGVSLTTGEAGGFNVIAQSVVFSSVGDERVPRFEIDREWLDGAELVIVRATYDGSVRRRLVIENFPVTPSRAGS